MKVSISYSTVAATLGRLLVVEAILLLIPLAVELATGARAWGGFAVAAATAGLLGGAAARLPRGPHLRIGRHEGFLLVSLAWIVFSAVGMIPFIMMGPESLSLSDAFFETVSGFTTTGATTIADVEALSHGTLLWRAMTQWIGGLGIILFMLALLPSLNERGGIPIFNAEVTGITHDKLQPRIRQTAAELWKIYILLTCVLILLLWAGPMSFFDAVCQAFATLSTGGFSTRNEGIAWWASDYVAVVLTIFMFLGGVNFTLLRPALHGHLRPLLRNDVLRLYALLVGAAFLGTALPLLLRGEGWSSGVVAPLFHVVSAITTTGFSLADFASWGAFGLLITYMLMLVGACAGSTSGALKVDRLLALAGLARNETQRSLYPRRVLLVRVNGNVLPPPELARTAAFTVIYLSLTVIAAFLLTLWGISIDDSFFAVLSCIGNNGLGYGLTGSEGGYHLLPSAVKWILALLMIAGRLELYSVMVLFSRSFWLK